MQSFDHPSVLVRREQIAVDGKFLFFQKAKLKAIHFLGVDGEKPKDPAEIEVFIGDEQIGKAFLTESFGKGTASTPLLDVMIPQGSVVYVTGGPAALGIVAEYNVDPSADTTDTNNGRR